MLGGFAAELVAAGVPMVLAMQAAVTNRYATALSAEFYRRLATGATPDPLLALAEARRTAERDRQSLPPGSPLRGPAEWATPALTTRALGLPLFNPREPFGPVQPPQAPVLADGVVVREVGDFVGLRAEIAAGSGLAASDGQDRVARVWGSGPPAGPAHPAAGSVTSATNASSRFAGTVSMVASMPARESR